MKFEITSSPKGKKTQFICTADGVEIGKRCSTRGYVKCAVVKVSKSFTLRQARASKSYSLRQASKYGRGAECNSFEEFVRVLGQNQGCFYRYVLDGSYAQWAQEKALAASKYQDRIEEIESGAADAEFEVLEVISWHMSGSAKVDVHNLILVAEVFA